MHSMRWDDLQYVLAVANEGSVAAAARAMGVNHSTVLRRLGAFEHRHKLCLFHRRPSGYKLTPEGHQLLDSARAIEGTVKALERRISGQEMTLAGTLRLTTTDTLLSGILNRHLAAFHRAYPRIQLELNITTRLLDLSRLDADVAIRPATSLPDNLTGVRICDLVFGIYGAPEYLNSLRGRRPLEDAHWLGFTPMLAQQQSGKNMGELTLPEGMGRRVEELMSPDRVVLKADSFEALRLAAEQGLGLALLPCFVGEASEKLQRVDISMELDTTSLWLMTHKDMAGSARVQAFTDFMEAALQSEHSRLAGVSD
ncbi:MAG: DNA-binding transcriptional LysR family regulator [Motiliproteus sp.]|jgi:DNA-binding transcriptional LysR family regulator